ncbi:MAG: hypothetical protein JXA57_11655 [Armatimonadetes bacterium]|nr:hypothetical protein [Armatimonadota bacterium]
MRRAWIPPAVGASLFLLASLGLHLMEADAYRWLAGWVIGLSSVDYFRAVTGYPSSWRVRMMYTIIVAVGLLVGLMRMPAWVRPEWVGFFMSTDPWTALRSALAPALVMGGAVALASALTIAELRHAFDSDDDLWDRLALNQMPDGRRWTVWSRSVISWIGVLASAQLAYVTVANELFRPVKRLPSALLAWFTMSLGVVLFLIGAFSTYLAYELGTALGWGAAGFIAETIIVGAVVALSADLGRLLWRGIQRRTVMLLPALALVAVVGVFRYSIGWSPEDTDGGEWFWYLLTAVRSAILCGYAALLLWAVAAVGESEGARRKLPIGVEWIALVAPITIVLTAVAYSGAPLWVHAATITYACAAAVAVASALLLIAPRAEYTKRRASVVWIGAGGCALLFAYIEVAILKSAGAIDMARLAVLFLGTWAMLGSVAAFGAFLTSEKAVSSRTLWKRTVPWAVAGLAVCGGSFALATWLAAQPYPDMLLVSWFRFASQFLLISVPGMLAIGASLIIVSGRLSQRAVERRIV